MARGYWQLMVNSPYTIRNYQPTDFNKYVLLNIEAEKLKPTGSPVSPQVIAKHLDRPNYYPEQDLFIVEIAGNIVGYMDVAPELTIGRVILNCWVHPEHRRGGLATKLLGYAMHRARELGARVAHANIMEDNVVAKRLLYKLDFSFVQRFLELRLDIAKIDWSDVDQSALECWHLQRGEEDKLAQIQNSCFTGTWGYNPNTAEEIIYRINLSTCSPEDVVLAYEGNEVIGYCWTEIICGGEAPSERKGRILMLGVHPDYRGRGVGKRVLLAGLAHLKSKDLQVAELTVSSANEVALALYQSIGFEIQGSTLWYEKVIN